MSIYPISIYPRITWENAILDRDLNLSIWLLMHTMKVNPDRFSFEDVDNMVNTGSNKVFFGERHIDTLHSLQLIERHEDTSSYYVNIQEAQQCLLAFQAIWLLKLIFHELYYFIRQEDELLCTVNPLVIPTGAFAHFVIFKPGHLLWLCSQGALTVDASEEQYSLFTGEPEVLRRYFVSDANALQCSLLVPSRQKTYAHVLDSRIENAHRLFLPMI